MTAQEVEVVKSTSPPTLKFEQSKRKLDDLEIGWNQPSTMSGNHISSVATNILNVVQSTKNATGPNQIELVEKAMRIYSLLLTDGNIWEHITNETEKSQAAYDLLVNLEKTVFTVNSTFTDINKTIEFRSSALPHSEFKAAFGTVKSSLFGVNIVYPNPQMVRESFIEVTAADLEVDDRAISFVGVSIDSKHIERIMQPKQNRNKSQDPNKIINSKVISLTVDDQRMQGEIKKAIVCRKLLPNTYVKLKLGQSVHQTGNIKTYVRFYHEVKAYGEKILNIRRKLHRGEKPLAVRSSASCTYWSSKENLWTTDGCEVYETSLDSTLCKCNHLTSFAVIMDVHNYVGKDPILEMLTLVLCPISGICLILAIILLSRVKNIQNQRTTITSHLCFCLLIGITLILFVADRNYLDLSQETCATVGVVTHYIFLAAFTWMGLEGVCMYKMIIRVFDSHRSSTKLYILAGYGVPAVLVGLTVAVGYGIGDEPYGNDLFCWLNGSYHYGFAVPAAIIIVGNLIVLYLVVKAARSQGSFAPTANVSKRSYRTWIQGLFSMTVLLGITWLPGFVVLTDSESLATISAYCFVLLNASQGIFLFVFNCALNEKVRKFLQTKSSWLTTSTSGPQVTVLTRNLTTSAT